MNQDTPTPGQISSGWGDPNKVQAFRNALIPQIGQKAADDYVNQYVSAYQLQQQQQIGKTIGQTQGAMTPEQATQNPVAATQFIGEGGKIINTGPGAQAGFINQAQAVLDKAKGKSKYVEPQVYNALKEQFSATGGDENTFDARFKQFTDPNKTIDYNTQEGRANQEAYGKITRQIGQQLAQYHSIPEDQKTLFSKGALGDVPVLGQLLAPDAFSYENNRNALAAQLKEIAGGGAGSGLKVTNVDMEKWANLLPSTHNTAEVNQKNIASLDNQIKAAFNVKQGLDSHLLPSKGRAPLAGFGQ